MPPENTQQQTRREQRTARRQAILAQTRATKDTPPQQIEMGEQNDTRTFRRNIRNQYVQRQKNISQSEQKDPSATVSKPVNKLAGIHFWVLLPFFVLKDLLDIPSNLSVILSITVWVTSFSIGVCAGLYMLLIGVRPIGRKIAVWLITIVMESIPMISFLPTYTISLFLLRYFEGQEQLVAFLDRIRSLT